MGIENTASSTLMKKNRWKLRACTRNNLNEEDIKKGISWTLKSLSKANMVSLVGLHFFQVWMMRQELENGLKHLTCHLNLWISEMSSMSFFQLLHLPHLDTFGGNICRFQAFFVWGQKTWQNIFRRIPRRRGEPRCFAEWESQRLGSGGTQWLSWLWDIRSDTNGLSWDISWIMGYWWAYDMDWYGIWCDGPPKDGECGWQPPQVASAGTWSHWLVEKDGQHEQLGYSGSGRWVIPSP